MTTWQKALDSWLDEITQTLTQGEEDLFRSLTADQVDRLLTEARNIDARYPDDDGAYLQDRKNAYVVTAEMLAGRTFLGNIHIELVASRIAARRVWVRASHAARMEVLLHKTPETEASSEVGIDRGTLRKMLDKEPRTLRRQDPRIQRPK